MLTRQRCQALHLLLLSGMVSQHDSCVFKINNLLKTSRPGKHLSELAFSAYSPDNRLCPILCLAEYVDRTKPLRNGSDQLLVRFQKLHRPVSTDTISQWLKAVLQKSRIGTSIFKGHSTRAVSTSAADNSQGTLVDHFGQWLVGLSFSAVSV